MTEKNRSAEAAELAALFTGLTPEKQQIVMAELDRQMRALAMKSTPARRAMYYATTGEILRGDDAIGDEWIEDNRCNHNPHWLAGLAYLAGVADGKRAERRRIRARRERAAEGQ